MSPDIAATDRELCEGVISTCRALVARGLTHGKSGNVSVRRDAHHFFVSPTGMPYEALQSDDIPLVDLTGRWYGRCRPSSEWRFHRDIFGSRKDVGAVVHTHSLHATALACNGRGIPAFHYMVAVAGGDDIRCAPYYTFGCQELSDAVLEALAGRKACLLANHGVIAVGTTLDAALALSGEVENLAAQYCAALSVGEPRVLDQAEMRRVIAKFATYGTPRAPDADLNFGGPDIADAQGRTSQ